MVFTNRAITHAQRTGYALAYLIANNGQKITSFNRSRLNSLRSGSHHQHPSRDDANNIDLPSP